MMREEHVIPADKRNVAVAESYIDGEHDLAVVVSGKESPAGRTPYDAVRELETGFSGAASREYDTEAKYLEWILKWTTPESEGAISLYTERFPCESCFNAIEQQWHNLRPNIRLNVTSGDRSLMRINLLGK
jgi:hypothetical protein